MLAGFCAKADEEGVLGVEAVGCWLGTEAEEEVLERDGRWDAETCEASQLLRGIVQSGAQAGREEIREGDPAVCV